MSAARTRPTSIDPAEPSQAGDHVTDIVTLPGGDLIVAGLFNNELDLGSVMLTTDDEASFIARFPSSP
jgi:hypothetical protein